MIAEWIGIYTCKECHKTESIWNHNTTDHKEGEQLEDRRNIGENSCNSEDGTYQIGPILDVYDDDMCVCVCVYVRIFLYNNLHNIYTIICAIICNYFN